VAISHALTVLGYFEVPEDERPPERMWLDDEALESHWEQVDQRRKHPPGSRTEVVPPAGGLEQNELTASFKR
jgi:hypothetical protein